MKTLSSGLNPDFAVILSYSLRITSCGADCWFGIVGLCFFLGGTLENFNFAIKPPLAPSMSYTRRPLFGREC